MSNDYKPNYTLREPDMSKRSPTVSLTQNTSGYELWIESITGKTTSVHQLLAIAYGADPRKVYSNGDWHTHHKNGIPWDNRPKNLEILTSSEHASKHGEESQIKTSMLSESFLIDKIINKNMNAEEIAKKYDYSKAHVRQKIKKHNLRWDQRWKR